MVRPGLKTYAHVGHGGLVELTGCLEHELQLSAALTAWREVTELAATKGITDAYLGGLVRAMAEGRR